ncbi:MAG: FliM/FliN family flagellar motor switch protein [Polyangiaceae bacterium]
MAGGRSVRPYPWQALERLTRSAARASGPVRRAVQHAVDLSALAPALGSVLGSDLALYREAMRVAEGPRAAGRAWLRAETSDVELCLHLEDELVVSVVSRLLARPVTLSQSAGGVDPALAGVVAAVVGEALRRAYGPQRWTLSLPQASSSSPGTQIDFTLVLDGRAFRGSVWLVRPESSWQLPPARPLSALGALPLSVPVVVGVSSLSRDAFSQLQVGDAFLPEGGWWIDSARVGACALVSGKQELGLAADLSPEGHIVVRGETRALSWEDDVSQADGTGEDPVSASALDAPLVVRIELGTVTLSAREWAELGPGDVIETGRRLAEPVILRVAGQEVARGELVDVEGELGVRIRSLSGGDAG